MPINMPKPFTDYDQYFRSLTKAERESRFEKRFNDEDNCWEVWSKDGEIILTNVNQAEVDLWFEKGRIYKLAEEVG